jgi:hypothetical protein
MEETTGKEGELLRPIGHLYVLVHPLWRTAPFEKDESSVAQFDQARDQMVKAIEENMVPRGGNDVALFIPLATKVETEGLLRESLRKARQSPQHKQWPDLYRRMKELAVLKRNVFWGPDIVEKPREEVFPAKAILDRLQHRGFVVTPDTQVIVGGEMLNPCVKEATEGLLSLEAITRVRVDKRATPTSSYLMGTGSFFDQEGFDSFAKSFEEKGFSVRQEDDFIEIKKG